MTGAGASVRVLLVDSDAESAHRSASALEGGDERLIVECATGVDESLRRLNGGDIDCIVTTLDVHDGKECIQAVCDANPELPCILCTAADIDRVTDEAIAAGVTDVVHRSDRDDHYAALTNRVIWSVETRRRSGDGGTSATGEQSRERVIADLHTATREMMRAETKRAIADIAVDAARDIVGLPLTSVQFHDDEENVLRPVAYTDDVEALFGTVPAVPPGESLIWRSFSSGRVELHDDVRADPAVMNPDTAVRSQIILPLGTHGALICNSTGIGDFERTDSTLARILAENATVALDRVDEEELLRTRTQQLARQNRELGRYEKIVETVGDPVYALDEAGRYTYVNESFSEQIGYERDALIGEHVSKVVPTEAVERGREEIRTLLREESTRTTTFEMERERASGEPILVENNLAVLWGADGEFEGTVGVLRDITGRKEWERRLEELTAGFETLVRSRTSGELYDEATTVTARILGFGTNSIRILDPETNELVYAARSAGSRARLSDMRPYALQSTPAGRAFRREELVVDQIPDPDPHGRDPLSTAVYAPIGEYGVLCVGSIEEPFTDNDLRLIEIVASNVRVSRRRIEREEELRAQNERLDQFATIVSHDLRNPLNVLVGSLTLARETGEDVHFERCSEAIDRMESLIDDLLTLARANARQITPAWVDVAETVSDCWTIVETADAVLELTTSMTIEADYARLRQLYENLLRNAVEHGGEDVTVTVGSLPNGDGFYVEDTGPGIPADQRSQVFEYGFTTDSSGTGLGLSIVKGVADAHGWTVGVTDGDVGGSRFEISGVTVEE